MKNDRLALYTTVYPGVEKYLFAWYESVLAQTDTDFDLWIGVDALDPARIVEAVRREMPATWVMAEPGDSPVQIRERAIRVIVDKYPAVVFVDSDDVLEPSRVKAARESLREHDVAACAMRLIDESGNDLGIIFRPPSQDIAALLPRYNVFGLSNTAYRSGILRQCLPIPTDCILMDWFLITGAWSLGASLGFDFECRMAYRQHPANIASVVQPFSLRGVLSATELVLKHYNLVLQNTPTLQNDRRTELESAHDRARTFYEAMTGSGDVLDRYIRALNILQLHHMWGECVAHPHLENIWQRN